MSNEQKKLEGAMRIFEALSGVDEQLLERCQGKDIPSQNKKPQGLWYYGKVMAACFCLVIIGSALWAGGNLLFSSTGMSKDTAVESEQNKSDLEGVVWEAACEEAEVEEPAAAQTVKGEQKAGKTEMSTNEQIQDTSIAIDSIVQQEACLPDTRQSITLEEAKETPVFGVYIPSVLPEGYVFESAYKMEGADTEECTQITVVWCNGMDSIQWCVSKVDINEFTLAVVSKPETYDVHLYEIPYAESVPQEYRGQFDNPIFAVNDFSETIVEARMKTVADSGDTDTPRGSFAVLYEEGILVEFNGRGDAKSIYSMFEVIP